MRTDDKLGAFLKELPREEPSANFTIMVMERVRLETQKSEVQYQPIISKQVWWKIFSGILLFLSGTVLLRAYFPGSEQPGLLRSFYNVDFSIALRPFVFLTESLSKIPLPYISGLIVISALVVIDQLHTRLANRY